MGHSHLFREDDEAAVAELFFDSKDDISSASNSCPGSPVEQKSSSEWNFISWGSGNPHYQVWMSNPDSVQERRHKFGRWMALDLNRKLQANPINCDRELEPDDEIVPEIEHLMSEIPGSGARSSLSSRSSGQPSISGDRASEENLEYIIKNLDDGRVFVVDELDDDGGLRSLREVGSSRKVTFAEFEKSFGSLPFIEWLMHQKDKASNNYKNSVTRRRRVVEWLRRLGIAACIADARGGEATSILSGFDQKNSCKFERVKVNPYRKRSKEMSALYNVQEIRAHNGAILTMKFNPGGKYLATGGEDGVVRVWRVMECERTWNFDVPRDDPSCMYLKMNNDSKLLLLDADVEKAKARSMKISSRSACVLLPQNIFWISEEPLHEFRGHDGDILDLSWSKNKHILSSSVDKTVCLWRVGCDNCLKVFRHTNYVTCVQFNPAHDDYFISGSIDGKVRVWAIHGCRVVDWVDVKELVTAVCYRQDGNGGVVGTISGNCLFYDASDNELQLESKVSVNSKTKSLLKRITGFQFCPSNPKKLLVTSADSKIRILDKLGIVFKYKGPRGSSSLVSASFTSDGQHVVSACNNSYIYVWNHVNRGAPMSNSWPCERFFSRNASLAIPWNGVDTRNPLPFISSSLSSRKDVFRDQSEFVEYASDGRGEDSFTWSCDFFSDFLHRGSATWPEEKLPSCSPVKSTLDKIQYKLIKTSCQNASHAWGQVIVTAGRDGRIRSFQNYGLPLHL